MPTDHLHLPALLIPLNIVLESFCKKPEQPENPVMTPENPMKKLFRQNSFVSGRKSPDTGRGCEKSTVSLKYHV
ncbi:MAG: hypothetical protein H6559_18940 [Lewinellaceae bacterium]|nr:hypothetical protein [Lewinellaceae bacterium]